MKEVLTRRTEVSRVLSLLLDQRNACNGCKLMVKNRNLDTTGERGEKGELLEPYL